jgi:hypothetical protein
MDPYYRGCTVCMAWCSCDIKGRRAQYHCPLNFRRVLGFSYSILLDRNKENGGKGKGTVCTRMCTFPFKSGSFTWLVSMFEGDIWVKRVTLTQLQSHPQLAQALSSLADTLAAYSTIILRSYRSRCIGPKLYSVAICVTHCCSELS